MTQNTNNPQAQLGPLKSGILKDKTMTKFGVYDTDMQVLYDIFTEVGNLDEVWIFGSRARNSFKAKSDFDLCLVRKDRTQKIKMYDLEEKIEESDFWYAVDVKDYDEITNPVFGAQIHRDAILIWKNGDVVTEKFILPKSESNDELKFVATSNTTVTENLDFPYSPQKTQNPYPIGWQEVRLGDVVNFVNDKIQTKKLSAEKYISTENLLPDRMGVQITQNLPEAKIVNSFVSSDILFSNIRTYFKKVWYASFDGGVSNDVLVLRRKGEEKINQKFLFYFISSDTFIDFTSLSSKGTKMPRGDKNAISLFEFPLPPLHEQVAIAGILGSLDDKIELLRDQNKTLEDLGQKLFQKELAENGDSWRVGKITEIIKREPVKYKCNKDDLDSKGQTPIIDQGINGLYGYTSRNPDFIASPDNPVILFTNHTCNYWFIDYPFCAIQNVLPFRGKDGYDEYFLYFMTKGAITFIEYKGHWPDFETKDFLIPTVKKAQEFSKLAKPILQKISANTQQIQTLSKVRDTLLPQLMSGKVRV